MENNKQFNIVQIGTLIYSPQNEKYQIVQKINNKKKTTHQSINTFCYHEGTFIVKKLSNRHYYILKRYNLLFQQANQTNKETKKTNAQKSPQKKKNFSKQLNNKILFHPNLLHVQNIFFQNKQDQGNSQNILSLIEQYCQEGDLAYFVKRQIKKSMKSITKQPFNQKLIAKWLLQILLGLQHLHYHKVPHLSLKPTNIYLTPLGNLKLNESYLLNSINIIKQNKKTKEPNILLEGYAPMLNDRKFKINEKKDIFDFGSLISYLCNIQPTKNSKAQSKNKNSHLSPSYSFQLDKIYTDCINVKKTSIQVKDILKTSYFIEIMREFIIDKKLNVSVFQRIPIKKYTIHKKTTPSKSIHQIIQTKNQKNQKNINQNQRLPKIEKNQKDLQTKKSIKKLKGKQETIPDLKKNMRASLQKLKSKIQINHKQKLSRQKKQRKNSAEKIKIDNEELTNFKHTINQKQTKNQNQKPKILTPLSVKKQQVKLLLPPPPSLQKNKKTISKSQIETNEGQINRIKSSRQSVSKQKKPNITRSQSQSPKKVPKQQKQFNLTPQITFGRKNIEQSKSEAIKTASNKVSEQERQVFLSQRQTQLQKISQNLAKIFCDLKIREDDEQQLSFQLTQQEEEQLRLTLKQEKQSLSGQGDLMQTYKSKFDQIISELQHKYQPNLETIIQKTNQWDSNDFYINQELLKRLRLQEGQSLLPYSQKQDNQFIEQALQNQQN